MQQIGEGLYVTELIGMGVNGVTGDYSRGAAGYWIENGELAYPVSEITIAGNLKDMFKNITPANDLTFRYSINAPTFTCGRDDNLQVSSPVTSSLEEDFELLCSSVRAGRRFKHALFWSIASALGKRRKPACQ